LEGYKNEIKVIKEKKLTANEAIAKQWEEYSSDQYLTLKSYTIGNYLLETTWDQVYPYNQSCPIDPVTGSRCVVGCGAVALGQILHYWDARFSPTVIVHIFLIVLQTLYLLIFMIRFTTGMP